MNLRHVANLLTMKISSRKFWKVSIINNNLLLMLLMVVRLRSLLMNYMKNLSIRSFLFVKRSVHHLFRPPLIQPIPDSLQAKTITILHDLPGLHPLMGLLWVTPQPTRTDVLLLDHSSVVATGVILRDMWSQNVQFFANSNQNLQPPPRSEINGNPVCQLLGNLEVVLQPQTPLPLLICSSTVELLNMSPPI